jgi:hypothetical protein
MLSHDRRRLRVIELRQGNELIVKSDMPVDIATVVSVELEQDSVTVLKMETTSVTKKSGVIGRAAIGGALFGGVGAIVGATSAGSKTIGSSTGRSHTTKGPVMLVVGTTDLHVPVFKIRMNSMTDGEEWLHRIRGSIAPF